MGDRRRKRQPSRRPVFQVNRDPSLPGPTPGQVAEAAKTLRERGSAPEWDLVALEPFFQWCTAKHDPFLDAYMRSVRKPDASGVIEPDEELEDEVESLARGAVERFEVAQRGALKDLADAVAGVDPVPILAGMIFLTRMRTWGSYYEPHSVPASIDLELVAAMVASGAGSRRAATVEDLRRIAAAAQSVRWWAHALGAACRRADDESVESVVRNRQLSRWLVMRGSAFPEHAQAVARELDRRELLRARFGFSVEDIIELREDIDVQWEMRITPAIEEAWMQASRISGETPGGTSEASEAHYTAFVEAAMRTLPAALCISLDREEPTRSGSRRRSAAIRRLSLRPGETDPVTSVLVDLPQRAKPFLILPPPLDDPRFEGNETAVLVHPGALTTELHLTVDALHSPPSESWSLTRANAVDRHTIALLEKVLPGARGLHNVFIETEAGLVEVDGVLVFNDIILVVEGKGAPLKTAAKRGGVDKLVGQLRELVTVGYDQLERDTNYVLSGRPARFFDEHGRCLLEVDGSTVRRCYQLMPTLDGLDNFGTSLPRLVDLGVLPEVATPWIVGLTYLHVVVDILTRPAEFIGYLEFRTRWVQERRLVTIDELELLNHYLNQVDLYGHIARLPGDGIVTAAPNQVLYDNWYAGKSGQGPVVSKPRVNMTTRIRRFVDERERLKPPGWLASTTAALQVPRSTAIELDELEHSIALRVQREGGDLGTVGNVAFLAIGQGDDWSSVLQEVAPLGGLDEVQLVCLLRQRGNRLVLDDVRTTADLGLLVDEKL